MHETVFYYRLTKFSLGAKLLPVAITTNYCYSSGVWEMVEVLTHSDRET
jgi:hypothetical protein